jgi:prolyl-tRNA synthetase
VSKGVAAVHWCGNRECADRLEEIADASVLGTEVRTDLIDQSAGNCIICGKPGSVVTLIGRSY